MDILFGQCYSLKDSYDIKMRPPKRNKNLDIVLVGVSVVVNYLLSMRFVFEPREGVSKAREFSVFLLLSISGLLLTEMLMWYSVERLHFHYLFSKIVVTGIVMVYNFVTRKTFIEKKK